MKKIIIIGALCYATWYFLIREPKPVVVLPLKAGATTDTVNPNDAPVMDLIQDISANYTNYTSMELQQAKDKLLAASQPVPVECIMPPCPAGISQVSKEIEDKAKALINQIAEYMSVTKLGAAEKAAGNDFFGAQ